MCTRALTASAQDGGVTWPHARTLEPGLGAYTSLSTLADGRVGCLYESGPRGPPGWHGRRPEEGGITLVLARFDLSWLTTTSGESRL